MFLHSINGYIIHLPKEKNKKTKNFRTAWHFYLKNKHVELNHLSRDYRTGEKKEKHYHEVYSKVQWAGGNSGALQN